MRRRPGGCPQTTTNAESGVPAAQPVLLPGQAHLPTSTYPTRASRGSGLRSRVAMDDVYIFLHPDIE